MRLNSDKGARTYWQMIGDGFREVGVLLSVFGPIACKYEGHEWGGLLQSHVVGFILLGVAFFGIGAMLEASKWTQ